MVLVDTSVWIEHLKRSLPHLSSLLGEGLVLCHEFVMGELACGNLKNREEILQLLEDLPQALMAQKDEVLTLIHSHRLYGKGIGWVDAHLLAATKISHAKIWTLDKKLKILSHTLGMSYDE